MKSLCSFATFRFFYSLVVKCSKNINKEAGSSQSRSTCWGQSLPVELWSRWAPSLRLHFAHKLLDQISTPLLSELPLPFKIPGCVGNSLELIEDLSSRGKTY